jgi:hypothetical protein
VPVKGSSEQAAKDSAGQALIPLHQRLVKLREQARSTARFACRFVMFSSTLLALIWLVIPVSLLVGSYLLMKYGYGSIEYWYIYPLCLFALGALYLVFRALLSLVTVSKLYAYYYRQTWRHLLFNDLAIKLAHDEYFQQVCDEFIENEPYLIPYFSRHARLEQTIETKCWFVRSLIAISKGATHAALVRYGWDDSFHLRQSWRFQPGTFKYLGCFGEQLLYGCTPLFLAPATLITAAGPDFIASRAVLVAFLDFMLEDPPPWVDQLTPPSDAKRPWWWRSVAPLMRE